MKSDIIDNRHEKLVDHIQTILPTASVGRFAVGYLFLSGLEALGDCLNNVKELRLLIGATTNRETIELLAEGRRRIDLVEEKLEATRFAKKIKQREWAELTALNLRESAEVMDQTDAGELLIRSLLRMLEEKRLKVRVYIKGRLHAKAYIFDYATPNPGNSGIAIVGSSNLTLSGIRDNTELNVLVHDNANPMNRDSGNHGALVSWFEELWEESLDFETYLMDELGQSWAVQQVTPYDIYMKALFTLIRDRVEGGDEREILWDDDITRDLADFQKVAVRQAIQMIRDNGGCFVADVVGMGKSYVGAAIIKHFERTEHLRPLIICPKALADMWIRYNEVYDLNANILPMSMLQTDAERGVNLLDDVRFRDRSFVLVDESHNFRHHSSQRYEELQRFLSVGRKVCLLTATPRNSRAIDLYNQIKLFHAEDTTTLPIDPPNLKDYFKKIENGERRLQDLLMHVLIRRTRKHILRWYGYAMETGEPLRSLPDDHCAPYLRGEKKAYVMVAGRHQFFPKRELEALRYSIEDTYAGLYQRLRICLGQAPSATVTRSPGSHLTYARYGIWNYVRKERQYRSPYVDLKRAGINLRGLIRTSLFKRFESSVEAFRRSLKRMIRTHDMFLKALEDGFVPAGEDAESLLGRTGQLDDVELLSELSKTSGRYDITDFDVEKLSQHISADVELLKTMLTFVDPIGPEEDAKLQVFLNRMREEPIGGNKCLVFTQYADTAEYLFEHLNPGTNDPEIDIIYGTDKSKSRMVGRFSPKSNPDFAPSNKKDEIRLLVATDVLAEGLNLQDCNVVLNYDLHWNPVRLIQRFGRIDRIGSEHDTVYGLNFLPETALDRELGIQAVLSQRIKEIHETIGEDAAILDKSEQLNEEAMYAIYASGEAGDLEEDSDDLMDLNEAEEFFRSLAKDERREYDRIKNLRDGIRSTKGAETSGTFVFCQAGRYSQLSLLKDQGKTVVRDLPQILEAIAATRNTPICGALPKGFNRHVTKLREAFVEEVKYQQSQREHSISLRPAQRYVLRELRVLFSSCDQDDARSQINEMERAFRMAPTAAVAKALNSLRRNGVMGNSLLKTLIEIYHHHRLHERLEQQSTGVEKEDVPRIICSEALVDMSTPSLSEINDGVS